LGALSLRELFDASVDGIITIDQAGLVTAYSRSCGELFGYEAEEVIGENVKMLMPPPYHEEHDGYLDHYAQTEEKKIIGIGREVVGRRKDGTTFPMHLSVGELGDAGSRGFVGIVHDLTLRDEAMNDSARLGQIVEESVNEIFLFDEKSLLFTYANEGGRLNLGYTAAELKSMTPLNIKPDLTTEEFNEILRPLRDGETDQAVFDAVHQRKDGSTYDVVVRLQLLRDETQPVFVAFILDITERNEARQEFISLQAEFSKASRVTIVNEMAAALTHELNQPLTAIANYLEAAQTFSALDDATAQEKALECLAKAVEQSSRAGEINRRLRSLAESGQTERQSEDVHVVVQEACGLVEMITDANLVVEVDDNIPAVMMDKIQIQQIITNLIRNAADALEGATGETITVRAELPNDEYIMISVSDTGPGIDPEVAANLFKPFATTKKPGMGMGLAICKSIVEAHSGKIEVSPNSGPNSEQGTTFRFSLPLS